MKDGSDCRGERTDTGPSVLPVLQTKAEIRKFYDRIAGVYDVLAETSERAERHAGLAKLDAAAGEVILEIGFGTGHSLVDIARAVGPQGRVAGIDLSAKMVGQAT
jgi:demethylmenaquinone methyltransferase/2-methoxy-6-polyprenyl-1,4-benzoquinol methylase